MKINDIIENIKKYHRGYGVIDPATTRDQILYGDPDKECTGIVTTCWANMDVIRYAIEKGANLIICHEALFWNHGDHQDWLMEAKVSTYLAKKKVLDKYGIVVWRDHDYIHSGIPYKDGYIDGIFYGLANKLGLENNLSVDKVTNKRFDGLYHSMVYKLDEEVNITEFARFLVDKLNLNGIKLIGNKDAMIRNIVILTHVLSNANKEIITTDQNEVDCILAMEMVDFTYMEYIRDSSLQGMNRNILSMGHFNLEEPGMEYLLTYLDEAIGEHVEAWYCQSGDNYQYITK